MSATIESEPSTNSADYDPMFPIFETSPETEFSSEYFTEMLLSYIFGPRMVKYDILSNNRRSTLHAVIDCVFFNLSKIALKVDARKRGYKKNYFVPITRK